MAIFAQGSMMRYNKLGYFVLSKKRKEDIGIDLPNGSGYEPVVIKPKEDVIVDTGIIFDFPLFGRARRFLTRLLFGVEITGIAGLLWPRSRHNTLVMAGVIDASYRGTIKVRLYNPTDKDVVFKPGEYVAQLVPVLSLGIVPRFAGLDFAHTDRNEQGGINRVWENNSS